MQVCLLMVLNESHVMARFLFGMIAIEPFTSGDRMVRSGKWYVACLLVDSCEERHTFMARFVLGRLCN